MDVNNNDSLDALGKTELPNPVLDVKTLLPDLEPEVKIAPSQHFNSESLATTHVCVSASSSQLPALSCDPSPRPSCTCLTYDGEYSYKMTHASRGRCIVINNKKFDDPEMLPMRTGTDVDVRSVRATFERLGFSVHVHCNQTTKEMEDIIQTESKLNHAYSDCLAVVILSHGSEGVVFGRDGQTISIDQLVQPLKGTGCKSLIGKPKLFFIQACRGEDIDHGVDIPDGLDDVDGVEINKVAPIRLPQEADTVFGYSTVSGYYSFKSAASGSYFIQSLCRMLDTYAHKIDLLKILTRVLNDIAIKFESQMQSQPQYHKKKQMPAILSMLTKDLYFTPKDV